MSFRLSWGIVVAFAGCGVSQAEYNIRTTELEKCQAEQSRAQVELGAAQARLEDKSRDLERRDEEIARMEGDARNLARSLSATEREMDALRRARASSEQRAELYRSLVARLREPIAAGALAVEVRRGKMLVRLGEEQLFDPAALSGVQLRPSGQQALKQVALALKEIPDRDFLVAGHTDNRPPKPYGSNWDLSTARAVAVVRFLQSEGVDPRHLAAAGYSEFDALDDNERARNRRIEIVVQPRPDELPSIDAGEALGANAPGAAAAATTTAPAPAAAPAAPATSSPPRPAAPTP